MLRRSYPQHFLSRTSLNFFNLKPTPITFHQFDQNQVLTIAVDEIASQKHLNHLIVSSRRDFSALQLVFPIRKEENFDHFMSRANYCCDKSRKNFFFFKKRYHNDRNSFHDNNHHNQDDPSNNEKQALNWSALQQLKKLVTISILFGGATANGTMEKPEDYIELAKNITSPLFSELVLDNPNPHAFNDSVLTEFLSIPKNVESQLLLSSSSPKNHLRLESPPQMKKLDIRNADGLTPKAIDIIASKAPSLRYLSLVENRYISKNSMYNLNDEFTTTTTSTRSSGQVVTCRPKQVKLDEAAAHKLAHALPFLEVFTYSSRSPICSNLQAFAPLQHARHVTVFSPLLRVSTGTFPMNLISLNCADPRWGPDYETIFRDMTSLKNVTLQGTVATGNNETAISTFDRLAASLQGLLPSSNQNNSNTNNNNQNQSQNPSSSSLFRNIQTLTLLNFEGDMSTLKDFFTALGPSLHVLLITSLASITAKDLLLITRTLPNLRKLELRSYKPLYLNLEDAHLAKVATRLRHLHTLHLFGTGTFTEDGVRQSLATMKQLTQCRVDGMILRNETIVIQLVHKIQEEQRRKEMKQRRKMNVERKLDGRELAPESKDQRDLKEMQKYVQQLESKQPQQQPSQQQQPQQRLQHRSPKDAGGKTTDQVVPESKTKSPTTTTTTTTVPRTEGRAGDQHQQQQQQYPNADQEQDDEEVDEETGDGVDFNIDNRMDIQDIIGSQHQKSQQQQ